MTQSLVSIFHTRTPLDAVWHHAINMKSRPFNQHDPEMIQIEFGEN